MFVLFAECRHETVSGYYRTSAYFLAKLFCDVMPQRVFPIVLFAVITYFMIGTHSHFVEISQCHTVPLVSLSVFVYLTVTISPLNHCGLGHHVP